MAEKDLWLKPHKAGEAWWYEESKHLEVHLDADLRINHHVVKIQWRHIRAALERLDK